MRKVTHICESGIQPTPVTLSAKEIQEMFPDAQEVSTVPQLIDIRKRGVFVVRNKVCILRINDECPNLWNSKECLCDLLRGERK